MAKLNNDIINLFVDTFDQATMLYYHGKIDENVDNTAVTNYNLERGRLNYYLALNKIFVFFLEQASLDVDIEISEKITYLFDNLYQHIDEEGINEEEIRQALLLLDIKGFKNCNFDLDIITPDIIGVIISYLLPSIINKKEFTLLDGNIGIGNLVLTIITHLDKKIKLIGIDNHGLLAQTVTNKLNVIQKQANIFHQDALEYLIDGVDIVISDIATYDYENPNYHSPLYDQGIKYFPYLYIEHYLNLPGDKYYIYLINNDFFEQLGNEKIRNLINTEAHIKALIVLPETMFLAKHATKSIMIINKSNTNKAKQTDIYVLPSPNDKDNFINILNEIKATF